MNQTHNIEMENIDQRKSEDAQTEEAHGSLRTTDKTTGGGVELRSSHISSTTMTSIGENSNDNLTGRARSKKSFTKAQIRVGRVQFAALCWTLCLAGWNDGTTGPLLPRIQEAYGVNFAVGSLLFIFNCVGFVGGAFSNIFLTSKLGFGKTVVLGSLFQLAGYCIQTAAPPFPVFILGYFLNGYGLALQDAQANGFVATLSRNPEAKMGIIHAAYGVGAFAAPLAATHFSQQRKWSFHFLISLAMAVVNTVALISVFRLRTQDACLYDAGEIIPEKSAENEKGLLKKVLKTRAVHFLAFFILFYIGVEVTIGGWIVTYIIDVRGGGPSSGYISSGFFGGLTVGRILLLWVNKKVGERRVLFIYAILSIALELIIWLVPSLIGNAIAVSLIGVLLGPMYSLAMNHASRVLPRWILTGAIGWIAGFGQAGSAILPFITGTISEKHGIKSLQPLLVAMMAAMTGLWAVIPTYPDKKE